MWELKQFKFLLWLFVIFNIYKIFSFFPWIPVYYNLISRIWGLNIVIVQMVFAALVICNLMILVQRSRLVGCIGSYVCFIFISYANPLTTSPDTGLVGQMYLFILISSQLEYGDQKRALFFYGLLLASASMYLTVGIRRVPDIAWTAEGLFKTLIGDRIVYPDKITELRLLYKSGLFSMLVLGSIANYLTFFLSLFNKKIFLILNSLLIAGHIFNFYFLDVQQVSVNWSLFHILLLLLAKDTSISSKSFKAFMSEVLKALSFARPFPKRSSTAG